MLFSPIQELPSMAAELFSDDISQRTRFRADDGYQRTITLDDAHAITARIALESCIEQLESSGVPADEWLASLREAYAALTMKLFGQAYLDRQSRLKEVSRG